jgi:hypothetical protein
MTTEPGLQAVETTELLEVEGGFAFDPSKFVKDILDLVAGKPFDPTVNTKAK